MSGSALLGLIAVSMAWLFFVWGAVINLQALRTGRDAIPVLPGIAGSLAAFFTVAWLQPPWPWLWIVAPLLLDAGCALRLVFVLARRKN